MVVIGGLGTVIGMYRQLPLNYKIEISLTALLSNLVMLFIAPSVISLMF